MGLTISLNSLVLSDFQLIMEALRKGVIEVDEVFGKLKIEDSKELTEEKIHKLIREYNKAM